jgi:hypothetical protein
LPRHGLSLGALHAKGSDRPVASILWQAMMPRAPPDCQSRATARGSVSPAVPGGKSTKT